MAQRVLEIWPAVVALTFTMSVLAWSVHALWFVPKETPEQRHARMLLNLTPEQREQLFRLKEAIEMAQHATAELQQQLERWIK